jgi:hypothetical protein
VADEACFGRDGVGGETVALVSGEKSRVGRLIASASLGSCRAFVKGSSGAFRLVLLNLELLEDVIEANWLGSDEFG